jgi:hypothetical protein
MITTSTVLVLGAGSSLAFGYPLGSNLRQRIIEIESQQNESLLSVAGLRNDTDTVYRFIKTFRDSQMYSIDAFLARRPEFADVGKKIIATILLSIENETALGAIEHEDHWYRYLFNHITEEQWDRTNFTNLSIITFNYDRSLEHYLLHALKNAYGKSEEETIQKLETLKIIHVYGSLGPTLPKYGTGYFPYNGKLSPEKIAAAANEIQVIPEGRNDSETLTNARNLLAHANTICFLGFGFDRTNIERLGGNKTCSNPTKNSNITIYRKVFATALGLTQTEISQIGALLGQENINLRDTFKQSNCISLLRETLILN